MCHTIGPSVPEVVARWAHESPVEAASGRVSVLVSFVVFRGGSLTPAEGRVEHVADAGDRARTWLRRTRKRVWVKVHRGFKSHRHRQTEHKSAPPRFRQGGADLRVVSMWSQLASGTSVSGEGASSSWLQSRPSIRSAMSWWIASIMCA